LDTRDNEFQHQQPASPEIFQINPPCLKRLRDSSSKIAESEVAVHIGTIQVSEKDGQPDLQFASREFDRRVVHEMENFLAREILTKSGLVPMYV
jgi:hypothetical protein